MRMTEIEGRKGSVCGWWGGFGRQERGKGTNMYVLELLHVFFIESFHLCFQESNSPRNRGPSLQWVVGGSG